MKKIALIIILFLVLFSNACGDPYGSEATVRRGDTFIVSEGDTFVSNEGDTEVIENTPPPQPVNLFPENGYIIEHTVPIFRWDSIADASAFHIQVSATSDFAVESFLADDDALADSQYTLNAVLPNNSSYYWRVKQQKESLWGEWSTVHSFSTNFDAGTEPDDIAFITVWDMSKEETNDESFPLTTKTLTFPLDPEGEYNFTIDWGDETIEKSTSHAISHTYAANEIYVVTITGTCKGFGFHYWQNRENAKNLVDVKQWGNVQFHNNGGIFRFCENLPAFTAHDTPNTTKLTNMYRLFKYAKIFNGDISDWNTSLVKNMQEAFYFAELFNGDLSQWNTSNVTNMNAMFHGARAFNQDISGWNTSEVTDMGHLFAHANSFNQDISSWNTTNVTNMWGLFACESFNQDISNWNTSKVTNMSSMFFGAEAFNQNISGWDTSKVTDMSQMFLGADAFYGDITGWDTSNVTDMASMFYHAHRFNQDISGWDTSKVTSMEQMFEGAWDFNQDISGWNTANVTNMNSMFKYAYDFTCGGIDIATWQWNVAKVESGNMQEMFNCSGLLSCTGTGLPNDTPSWYVE